MPNPNKPVSSATTSTAGVDRRVIHLSRGAENIAVAPGGQATVPLTVYNPGAIVENIASRCSARPTAGPP
jgi:hypothetical protein